MSAGTSSQWQENLADIASDLDTMATNSTSTLAVEGATTDAAVVGDNAGTLSAKLRGLSKILNDIWDSTNHQASTKAVAGAIVDLATLLTLAGTPGDANTVASLMGRLTKIRDLLNGTLTISGNVTEVNSASIMADLATLAGVVSSNKVAVKAASGDFADGAIASLGAQADAAWSGSGSGTEIAILKKIVALLAATLTISGTVQPGNTQNTTPWLFAGPTATGTQAANTNSNTVIKASADALWSAVITATGTAGLDIFDNSSTNSGTKLLSIPANAAVGTIYSFPGGQPAVNGIVSAGVNNCPGVTFGYR